MRYLLAKEDSQNILKDLINSVRIEAERKALKNLQFSILRLFRLYRNNLLFINLFFINLFFYLRTQNFIRLF